MATQKAPFIFRLFSGLWKTITWFRVALLNVIFLAIIVAIIASITQRETLKINDKTLLSVAPTGVLVDEYTYIAPIERLTSSDNSPPETLVRDLVSAIDMAADDSRIDAMALELDKLAAGGISKLEEIGAALTRFRATGKKIYAYGSNMSQHQYYLASFADEISLDPFGSVVLTGFASYRNYFKDALDKLKVSMHIFRAGQYKDAMEPFLRNDMSDASREHNQQWLESLWGAYTSEVEALRELPEGTINDYINNMSVKLQSVSGDSAQLALDTGLVDQLNPLHTWQKTLSEQYGARSDGSVKSLGFREYLAANQKLLLPTDPKVALIVARGTIKDGYQNPGEIGDKSFQELIDQVKDDSSIKALVLRIDSGGGGVFASEKIRQSLLQVREKGLPIVVSMGSVAASGGYWIATPADEIWATPTTITGSIGVFGAFLTLEQSLAHLGINTDGLGTTELAGAIRMDRELSPAAESLIQQGINNMYQRFITLVAEARNSTPQAIDEIAQGRVWSGDKALELGLVDQLGNLEDVIARAAKLAELDNYEVVTIKQPTDPVDQFVESLTSAKVVQSASQQFKSYMMSDVETTINPVLLAHFNALLEPFNLTQSLTDPRGMYVLCMECRSPQ
ncbi:signal peptide peptidase SppA [Sessilibacter sp. MAH1]